MTLALLRINVQYCESCNVGHAPSVVDPAVEAAVLMVINDDGHDVIMIPLARMIDDIEKFMDEFSMDPDLHMQK